MHPNHEKLPGVCSSCLRERLSQLFAASETSATSSATFAASASLDSSSSSWRFSSASSSFYHSPPRHRGGGGGRRHHRNASEAIGSVFLAVNIGGGGDRDGRGLRKSRSIAVVPEKKRGFWRRLLLLKGGRSRKEDGSGLRRPRPVKEIL